MDCFIFSKAGNRMVNIPMIEEFEFIEEFGHERYIDVKLASLNMHYHKGIEICFIKKGKYSWTIDGAEYTLFPGDGFITCPWQFHGNAEGVVDLGDILWLIMIPEKFDTYGNFLLSEWTRLSLDVQTDIGKTLALNNNPVIKKSHEINRLFEQLYSELTIKDVGYTFAVRNIIETLFLVIVRLCKNRTNESDNDNDWLKNLSAVVMSNIEKKWKIEELAEILGMSVTSLNNKIKKTTGFSSLSFIINLRIEEAKKLLLNPNKTITDIALSCGFYSSQHFSTTFSQRIGITPTQYRKNRRNKIF